MHEHVFGVPSAVTLRNSPPMDHRAIAALLDGQQLARISHPEDLTHLGRRRQLVLLVEAVDRVGQRGGEHAAGRQVLVRAPQESEPTGPAVEQLQVCIGTMISANRWVAPNSRASAVSVRTGRPSARHASASSSAALRSSATTSTPSRARARPRARARA
jgi:hypothetical protein